MLYWSIIVIVPVWSCIFYTVLIVMIRYARSKYASILYLLPSMFRCGMRFERH